MQTMISILIIAIIPTLWFLSDTITQFLSKGKSFAPNETKYH